MNKKIISFLLSLTCAAHLTACGASTEDTTVMEDKPYIAVICKGSEHEFWQAAKEGATDAGNELGIDITFTAPENESQIDKQIELIEEAISNGADALLVAPLDVDALNNTLRSADEKGIPIITFDSDVSYSGRKATIGTENSSAGAIAAREATKLIDTENAEIGVVGHVKGAQTAIERVDGFMNEMKKYENILIKEVEYSDGNIEKAKNIAIEMINSNPELDLIYATNEGAAVGVCEAVEQLGKIDDIDIIGFDSSTAEVKYIENGVLDGMVVQNPYNMGYLGVRYLEKVLGGESIESNINTGATYVNMDNLKKEEIQQLLYPTKSQSN